VPRVLTLRAIRVAVAASFAFLIATWIARPWVGGDTPFVLDGTNAFLTCLSNHDYDACGFTGKLNYWGLMSPIGDWPLLQHVPDLIALGFGADGHAARTRILAYLSVLGVVASVVLGWRVLSRTGQRPWFWAFLLVVLSGPILAYARTTAGEMLAMGLLVCLVAATLVQAHPAVIAAAAVGACWTKETAYPFVAALGVLGLVLAKRRTGRPIRPHLIAGAAGMAVAITAASLFNVVRFGSVLNENYLDSQLHTPGIGRKVEYTLAVAVSPSGGVLVFWPAASVLVLAACLLPLMYRRKLDPRPAVVIAAVIVVLSVGFASWWTPFGWSAYGPRFALPWVLPLVLIALVAYADELVVLVQKLLASTWRLALVFVVVLAFTLPNIGHMWRPGPTGRFFLQQNPPCDAPWRGGVEKWNQCQHEQMWFDRPMPLYALDGVKTAGGIATSIIVGLGLLGCLILLREELRPEVAVPRPRAAAARR
jgi:hypothetical protein